MKSISFDEFKKVDIRIGTVIEACIPQWSHSVIRFNVNFGDKIGKKVVFSGIMKFFKTEDFIDKQFPFIVNLEPKEIGPDKELSEAVLIMADPGEEDGDDVKPVLFILKEKVPDGTKVR